MSIADPGASLSSPARPSSPILSGARDPRLDFFRGLAMFIILGAHTPGNFLTLWIPARFGFSDATEIFVFCSGMASAIAFGRVFRDRSFAMGTARVVYRIWQVYWAHICLFFATAAMLAWVDSTGQFERVFTARLNLLPFFDDNPAQQLVGLMTLTYVPNYFDVLPMYLVVLAMMPIVMALSRISANAVFAFIGLVWLAANLDLIWLPAEPWSDREWFFNPFGWQLIFFTGFAFIMFTSDHGDMLGNHGMAAKRIFYERSANFPMILSANKVNPKAAEGALDDRLVGFADVMPPLLDLCDIAPPATVDGISMVGAETRAALYGECGEDDHATRMIRDSRYKLIYYPVGDHSQLFDLAEDPHEMTDLAPDPDHAGTLARLQAGLVAEIYGTDLDWIRDGKLVGKPDRPYAWAPHRSLNSQRGDGWPPSPKVEIPQIEWTKERQADWPSNS